MSDRKIFTTSDTHWGHKNIIHHDKRPFSSIEEMDSALISNWNSVVGPEDLVYHLGDVSLSVKEGYLKGILWALNGEIILVKGNHDEFLKHESLRKRFSSIHDYLEVNIDHRNVVLCHYPFLTWRYAHKGTYHFHGHCHGSMNHLDAKTTRYDVGTNVNNFTPQEFKTIYSILSKREYEVVDHHGKKADE